MYSEHIGNLHPGWVVGGWLVAVSVASGVFLALVGLGFLGSDSAESAMLVSVCIVVGFFVGGFFVGVRWVDAPILHGVAITVLSVLVWFLGEVILPRFAPGIASPTGPSAFALGVVLLQLVSAVAGGWAGRRWVLGGSAPPEEVVPAEVATEGGPTATGAPGDEPTDADTTGDEPPR